MNKMCNCFDLELPMVSIVIPTYRRDKDLERALESLGKLVYHNFEIVLVDDNDDSEWNSVVNAIVNNFKRKFSTIKITSIVNHPNKGSAVSRNIGITFSKGEYICFLDDDDIYLPPRIINQLFPMVEKNADFSITDLALYDDKDKLLEKRKRSYIKDCSQQSLLKYHLMYHMTGTDTLMFKKNYLNVISGFDPIDVGDEFYLVCKAIEQGGEFLYVPNCDVKAYVHQSKPGISNGEKRIPGEKRLYEFKKGYFDNLSLDEIKFIKVRHYLVLAAAYFKDRKYVHTCKELMRAMSTDLFSTIRILAKR